MSVSYHLVGQAGNQLYPQIIACLTALRNNLSVQCENILVKFKNIVNEDAKNEKNIDIKRSYYQDEKLYNPYRDLIKTEIIDIPSYTKNTKDIVIHLRLDGFNHKGYNSHIIHPDWYTNILKKETFDKLYIVMASKNKSKVRRSSKKEASDAYLAYFDAYNPIVISENEYHDFHFILSFDKIISSNSTFAWWAAFLSDASIVYLPPIWEGRNSRLCKIGEVSKVVSEHYCYVNIDTFEKVRISYN